MNMCLQIDLIRISQASPTVRSWISWDEIAARSLWDQIPDWVRSLQVSLPLPPCPLSNILDPLICLNCMFISGREGYTTNDFCWTDRTKCISIHLVILHFLGNLTPKKNAAFPCKSVCLFWVFSFAIVLTLSVCPGNYSIWWERYHFSNWTALLDHNSISSKIKFWNLS